MAGPAVIGALRVVLGADSAALDKGLKDAQSSLAAFSSSFKKAVAGLSAGAVVGALGLAFKNAADEADKLGKAAQKFGVPVEELSKLKHAADLSDVSLEQLGGGLVRLSRNMSDVAGGAVNQAAMAFKALDINVKNISDGSLKSSSQVLTEVAGKFEKFKDGVGKTALAVALFGKSGAELIPLLNSGAAGLQEMMQEAEALGLVIDQKTAKSAELFNDNMTRLGKVTSGIILKITAEMLPAFSNLSSALVKVATDSNFVTSAAQTLTSGIQGAVSVVVTAITVFQRLGAELSALGTLFNSFGNWAAMKEAWTGLQTEMKKSDEVLAGVKDRMKSFWDDAAQSAVKLGTDLTEKVNPPLIANAAAAKAAAGALDSFFLSAAKKQAQMTAEIQTIGLNTAAQEQARMTLEALTIAKEKNLTVTESLRQKIDSVSASYGALKERLETARTAWGLVDSAVNSTASALADVVLGTKSAAEAFKAMAAAIIRQLIEMIVKALLFKAITMTFGGPFGGLFSGGGSIGFAGGGTLSIPGAANGMNFKVPGGVSVSDNMMMPIGLASGERVKVEPNRYGENGFGSGSDAGGTLRVEGIRPEQFYTGDHMIALAKRLIDFQRDGGKVVLA